MIREIKREVSEAVSPEMLQEAKNLRNLAASIESGKAVALGCVYVFKDDDGGMCTSTTYACDSHAMSLLGGIAQLQVKFANRTMLDAD